MSFFSLHEPGTKKKEDMRRGGRVKIKRPFPIQKCLVTKLSRVPNCPNVI